jgi:dTDP-L-rhamnose 4-epimerase
VVNIGSGVGRPIGDIARTLATLTGRDDLMPDITERYRRGDIRHCIADIARAREMLEFEPRVRWEDGLAEVVEWARSSPSADRTAQAVGELEARGLLGGRRSATGARV